MKIDLYSRRYLEPGTAAAAAEPVDTESQEYGDDIAAAAYAEMDGKEPPKKKEPPPTQAEPPAKEPADDQGEPQTEEGTKPVDEEQTETTEEAADDAQPDDKKPVKKATAASDLTEEVIQAHAEKSGMTFVQAKDELEAIQAVVEKYQGDPKELAKALRSTQREYDRLKTNPQTPARTMVSLEKVKGEIKVFALKNKDAILNKYRTDFPNRTQEMTEEAILEWAQADALTNYQANAPVEAARIKNEAATRRNDFLSKIPAEDARFVHDVKMLLNEIPDQAVIRPDYDIQEILWMVQGQRSKADIKAAYERGKKDAGEERRIVGVQQSPGAGAGNPVKKVVSGPTKLNAQQKSAAYDQFPDSSEASAEKMWAEVYADDLKKKSDFLP